MKKPLLCGQRLLKVWLFVRLPGSAHQTFAPVIVKTLLQSFAGKRIVMVVNLPAQDGRFCNCCSLVSGAGEWTGRKELFQAAISDKKYRNHLYQYIINKNRGIYDRNRTRYPFLLPVFYLAKTGVSTGRTWGWIGKNIEFYSRFLLTFLNSCV